MEEFTSIDTKAPFNMAIATLMSLRNTLDEVKTVERKWELPAYERQRIKIELVKRFYVDSAPLIASILHGDKTIEKFKYILDIEPINLIKKDPSTLKTRKSMSYCSELNKKLDTCLLELQLALGKGNYYMPPREDYGSSGMKMS